MKRLLFTCLMTGLALIVSAQVKISGYVTDSQSGKPLGKVIVSARDQENKMKGFTQTKTDGTYTLTVAGEYLHFSIIGYKKKTINLTAGRTIYDVALEQSVIELKEPAEGFADGVYTIEMRSGKDLTFYRFSVMPYLKNTHATAKIFSPSYSGHWGTVDRCPEYYLQRLQHVGYGCLGHTPVFTDEVIAQLRKYNIMIFDSGCVGRGAVRRYKDWFPDLADKLVPGHVYFGVMNKGLPHSTKVKAMGLLGDYRLLGGWNAEYKAKFQDAVKKVLKRLPGRFA